MGPMPRRRKSPPKRAAVGRCCPSAPGPRPTATSAAAHGPSARPPPTPPTPPRSVRRVKLSERVGCRTEVLPDVLAGPPGQPRHAGVLGLPVLFEAPRQMRQPADPTLVQQDLERRVFLEHALADHAHDMRHVAL